MKVLITLLAVSSLSATLFLNTNSLPEQIPDWVLEYHDAYAGADSIFTNDGIPLPESFYDQEVVQILSDSFLITDITTPLKVQALALKNEQVRYGYDWIGVATGYGLVPGNGNYWEDISFGRFHNEAYKYVVNRLIRNRTSQRKLYNWAAPTLIAAYSTKPDTAQALDMFAVWKATMYLSQYDYNTELTRSKKVFKEGWGKGRSSFTHEDWKGREDSDAKIYAFWHRRISDQIKTGIGFSLADAQYWSVIAARDMWLNSSQEAKDIFNTWRTQWENGDMTAPDRCMLSGLGC